MEWHTIILVAFLALYFGVAGLILVRDWLTCRRERRDQIEAAQDLVAALYESARRCRDLADSMTPDNKGRGE